MNKNGGRLLAQRCDPEWVAHSQGGFQQQNPPLHHRAARTAACRRRQEVGKAAARAGRSGGSRISSILDAAAGAHP